MEKLIWVSFFAFCLACPAWGQAAKGRALPVEDYGRWGTLYNEGISATGQWLSYSVSYESGADTLFVRSRTGSPAYSFAGGHSGQFIGDTMFGCLSKEGVFSLTSLQGNSTWEVAEVMSYRVAGSGRRIVLFCRASGPALSVQVRDLNGALLLAITGVTAYAISPDNAVLCYGVNDGWGKAMALDLERLTLPFVLCTAGIGKFTGFAFEPSGASVAFMHSAPQDSAAPELLHYRFSSRKLRRVRINCGTDGDCAVGGLVVPGDGQRVLFTMPAPAQQGLPAAGARPATWNAADKELYSFRSRYKGGMLPPRLGRGIWHPERSRPLPSMGRPTPKFWAGAGLSCAMGTAGTGPQLRGGRKGTATSTTRSIIRPRCWGKRYPARRNTCRRTAAAGTCCFTGTAGGRRMT